MSDRYFIDTNVFIYCFDTDAPGKAKTAIGLIRKAVTSRRGVVSYQVVQEFLNFALKRASPPMKVADAELYLATFFRPLLSVHSSQALFSEALYIQEKNQLSWYDSLIVAAALEAECTILYSEDLQHGRKFGTLQIQNPFLQK